MVSFSWGHHPSQALLSLDKTNKFTDCCHPPLRSGLDGFGELIERIAGEPVNGSMHGLSLPNPLSTDFDNGLNGFLWSHSMDWSMGCHYPIRSIRSNNPSSPERSVG
jgi:hypothetical protein